MTKARSTLEALITNDPEHPAIRSFVVNLQITLDLRLSDETKISEIRNLVTVLEKQLKL